MLEDGRAIFDFLDTDGDGQATLLAEISKKVNYNHCYLHNYVSY